MEEKVTGPLDADWMICDPSTNQAAYPPLHLGNRLNRWCNSISTHFPPFRPFSIALFSYLCVYVRGKMSFSQTFVWEDGYYVDFWVSIILFLSNVLEWEAIFNVLGRGIVVKFWVRDEGKRRRRWGRGKCGAGWAKGGEGLMKVWSNTAWQMLTDGPSRRPKLCSVFIFSPA